MAVCVIVGTQWGDEGKGKITDILAETHDIVVRFQGGNNAGHTVVVGDTTFKLHLIPSGILYDTCVCLIANGVVINPKFLFQELDTLKEKGIVVTPSRLKISSLAHVILPFHQELDLQEEAKRHEQKIGTTGKGIGPCYTDKISRRGIRIQDLLNKDRLRKKIEKHKWEQWIPGASDRLESVIEEYAQWGEKLAPYVVDSSLYINNAINNIIGIKDIILTIQLHI
jgi:adenylosuccinate synthase